MFLSIYNLNINIGVDNCEIYQGLFEEYVCLGKKSVNTHLR